MLKNKARIDTQFIDDVKMGEKERFMDTSLTTGGSRITTPISYVYSTATSMLRHMGASWLSMFRVEL